VLFAENQTFCPPQIFGLATPLKAVKKSVRAIYFFNLWRSHFDLWLWPIFLCRKWPSWTCFYKVKV